MSSAKEGDGCKKIKEEAAAVVVDAVEKRTSRRGMDELCFIFSTAFKAFTAAFLSSFVKNEFG